MRTFYLPGATLLLWLCTAIIPIPVHANSGFNEKLVTILQEEGLTGISWAMLSPENGVMVGANGLQNASAQEAFGTDARVHVGSVAKTMLATGILRLASEGKLDLYAPVQQYLPDLSFDNPWQETSPVRLRHLLDHTSGLSDAYLWQLFSEEATPDTPLTHALTRSPEALRVRSRPGMRLSYSNMGYTLLGLIIERVTGERYETYLDREFLKPLGMTDSSFMYTSQTEGTPGYDLRLAWGHYDGGIPAAAAPTYLRPAGQFTTTPHDMAIFMAFLMGDGRINDAPFIQPELTRARGNPLGTEASSSGLIAGYALGLGRRDRFGSVGYCHKGNILGFVAMLCVYPDEQKAFFYSVNTDSETADYDRIEEAFVRHLAPSPKVAPATDLMARDIRDWEGVYTLTPNRFQSFEMFDIMNVSLTATLDNGTFILSPFGGKERVLRGTGEYLFSANDRTTNSHVFMVDENGDHLISDGFQTYKKTNPAIVYGIWLSLTLAGLGLVWVVSVMSIEFMRNGRKARNHHLYWPFVATMALFVPLPFFLMQSFMALGDLTIAAALLAVASLGLPVAAVAAQVRIITHKDRRKFAMLHALACLAILQFCGLLFHYGMMPVMTWTL